MRKFGESEVVKELFLGVATDCSSIASKLPAHLTTYNIMTR